MCRFYILYRDASFSQHPLPYIAGLSGLLQGIRRRNDRSSLTLHAHFVCSAEGLIPFDTQSRAGETLPRTMRSGTLKYYTMFQPLFNKQTHLELLVSFFYLSQDEQEKF